VSRTVEPDGTVVYRYKGRGPVRYKRRGDERPWTPKQRSEQAVRFGTRWFEPLELLAEDRRTMPKTRPDEDGVTHKMLCRCDICKDNERVVKLKRQELGLKP
jgi:hypothetical protein